MEEDSTNPNSDTHLPVSGEFTDEGTISDDNPLNPDSLYEDPTNDELLETNDMNKISAGNTDQIQEAPDPEGPANPTATNG